jgi:hypothetical protein
MARTRWPPDPGPRPLAQDRQIGTAPLAGATKTRDPAGESLAGQPERASADPEVRPGPRPQTLRPHHVKTPQAGPRSEDYLHPPCRIFVSLRSGNNRSAHAQIVQFGAALVTSASPGIRVHLWVALPVDVRCSDTVAGRKRDGASKRSRRGAPYCQRRPILTPGRAGVSAHVPVDGYKEDRPPKPRAWLRGAVAIGGSDDSARVHESAG